MVRWQEVAWFVATASAGQPIGAPRIIDRKPGSGLSEHEKLTLTKQLRMAILQMKTKEIIDAASSQPKRFVNDLKTRGS